MATISVPLLALSACGSGSSAGSAAQSDSSPLTYRGPDREEKLIKGAKKEGKLTWYTSLAGDSYPTIVKAFEEKYPFIDVSVYRSGSTEITTRVLQETRAGKHVADVVETTAPGTLRMRQAKILAPYFTSSVKGGDNKYVVTADAGLTILASDRISYIAFGYNTEKLPKSAVPSNLEDLLDPALKGKLAIEATSSTGVRWIGSVLHELGQEEGKAFLRKLGETQDVRLHAVSGAAMMGLVASGEVTASPSVYQSHAVQERAAGAQVEWVPIGSVVANVGNVGVLKDASHPNAAALFVDFLLGDEGSRLLKEEGYALPTEEPDFATWAPVLEEFKSVESYGQQYELWGQLREKFFA